MSMYIYKGISGNREEGSLHGGGADTAEILVRRLMQNITDSKEPHIMNKEDVA